VHARRLTLQRALACRPEEVGLQLDRREPGPALGEKREAPVSARGVRERDDRAGVEIAVRRQQLLPQRQPEDDAAVLDGHDLDAE
jgi:hypothetical protein